MIAYKLFSTCPVGQKPVGIPDAWPWQTYIISDEQEGTYLADGCLIAETQEIYDAYLALHQADFDAWNGVAQVPLIITARQIRLAMVGAGIVLADVTTMINSLDEPTRSIASVSWDYASEFHRNDPLLVALARKSVV